MDKKAEIIQIMHENGSHDHNYGHLDIEHDDVDFIAEEIIKLFAIPVVVGQSEQLCDGLHSTDFNGKCFKCGEQVFVREPK